MDFYLKKKKKKILYVNHDWILPSEQTSWNDAQNRNVGERN